MATESEVDAAVEFFTAYAANINNTYAHEDDEIVSVLCEEGDGEIKYFLVFDSRGVDEKYLIAHVTWYTRRVCSDYLPEGYGEEDRYNYTYEVFLDANTKLAKFNCITVFNHKVAQVIADRLSCEGLKFKVTT